METQHGTIRQLPPAVADAIAAGEVVERPASVVKELCENAIDAGASRLEVEVDGGGLVRIRVADDGRGIPASELPLAVARHATSKLQVARDLESVTTLGFRGEALASIAAVSELTLISRTATDAAAALLRVRASTTLERGATGAAPGTAVEVRDLFFATPARLRFLRTERTEVAEVQRVVADCVLAAPRCAVSLVIDGRLVLQSAGDGASGALDAVFGDAARDLVAIEMDRDGVEVTGAVSQPRAHRGTRGGLVVLVNGRRVQHRGIQAVVESGYRGLLPLRRYPFGVVRVDLHPREVDVNVHPAKREVRFRDERRVLGTVERAVREAVMLAAPYVVSGWGPASADALGGIGAAASGADSAMPRPAIPALADAPSARVGERPTTTLQPDAAVTHAPAGGRASGPSAVTNLSDLAPLRTTGQALDSWVLATSPRGVVIVDQHAAHEKVLYARLLQQAEAEGADGAGSQGLLIPVLVEVDALQAAALDRDAAFVSRLGFDVEPFGPTTVRCSAVPARGRSGDPAALVRSLLDGLVERDEGDRRHRVCALVACHTAVRLGDALSLTEQQRLLDELADTPGGITCPHGRPTVLVLDDAALRRAFRRPPV